MIRVALPAHLRTLAKCGEEVEIDVVGTATTASIIDALEQEYPMLRGTIRDRHTKQRRPFLRFFADGVDVSLDSPDIPLPVCISDGLEPFLIIGAIAGG